MHHCPCIKDLHDVSEIVGGSYIDVGNNDDDAFSSPPFASGFGREEEDGPSAPPPFGREEPPPSFKSKLPTSGFRDPSPTSGFRDSADLHKGFRDSADIIQKGFRDPPSPPKIRRPRRPYPTVGGGEGPAAEGGGGVGDQLTCFPPTCIPPSTVAALPPLPPSSSHHPLPPLHDEHNRDIGSFFFLDSNDFDFNRTSRMISQSRSRFPTIYTGLG